MEDASGLVFAMMPLLSLFLSVSLLVSLQQNKIIQQRFVIMVFRHSVISSHA